MWTLREPHWGSAKAIIFASLGDGMTEYDLSACGIIGLGLVEVEGVLTELRIVPGARIVFLFDEHHTTAQCIAENIQNAQILIDDAGVNRLYVESHAAGQAADQLNVVSGGPQFADHFIAQGNVEIEGVENRELFDQQHLDVGAPLFWHGITLHTHPYDRVRSHCFIGSLFRSWRGEGMTGNVVLNAGRHHVDDIRDIIQWGEIDTLTGVAAVTYIRIRPTSYP
jgi:hypothetical protein